MQAFLFSGQWRQVQLSSLVVSLTVFVLLFRFSLKMFGDDRHLPWSDSGLQYLPSLQDHEPKFMLEISSSRCHKNLSQGRSGVRWCWELRVDLLWSRWHCTINIDICQHAILQLWRWAYKMKEDSSYYLHIGSYNFHWWMESLQKEILFHLK